MCFQRFVAPLVADGKYIAFASNRAAVRIVGSRYQDREKPIDRAMAHRDFYISKPSEMMAWSPDSKELALRLRSRDSPQIVDPASLPAHSISRELPSPTICIRRFCRIHRRSQVRQLTHGNYDAHSISWSLAEKSLSLQPRPRPGCEFPLRYYALDPQTARTANCQMPSALLFTSLVPTATHRIPCDDSQAPPRQHCRGYSRLGHWRDGGAGKSISDKLDGGECPTWSSDSQHVYFLAGISARAIL